ncbi:MAG: TIGR02302 family protein [Rhodobacteraceae bacterium]|nr:TIGR02302 family protein [Paracoccaceae bacterium]
MPTPRETASTISARAMKSLRLRLRTTQAAIVLERGAQSFWPLISWTLVVVAVVRLGLLEDASQTVAIISVTAASLCWLYLFAGGARKFNWPRRNDVVQRLDQSLPGRPLEALGDTQSVGAEDPASRGLWAMHLAQMAEAAKRSRAAMPDLRLARRDPWALRLVAIFVFASAILFSRTDPVQSLIDSLQPQDQQFATGPSFEGWAEPPIYTGKPSIYLNDTAGGSVLNLPEGSKVTLRIYGDTETASLIETVTQSGHTQLPADAGDLAEVTFEVTKDGTITLTPAENEPVSWQVQVIPDQSPTVKLVEEISRTVQGSLKMPFHAQDDYGIVGGSVTIALQIEQVDRRNGLALEPEPRETVVFDLPLPFNRDTTDFTETVIEDLAQHPWAGLPVTITLEVFDDAQQIGHIEPLVVPMPGKRFFDKLAAAVAEQRRDLLWNRENGNRISMILKAITHEPDTIFDNNKAYLMVRTALRRLDYNRENGLSDVVRDDIADLLWQAALLIEDGDLSDARERLKRAQDRLSEAMENGATDEEIAELMDELRRATQEYLRQLAQEQRNRPQQEFGENQNQMDVTQDQLQQMMDRIQELMEQGRMDEAQALMEQLQQMMENMQVTQGQPGQGDPNQQGMEGLGDTLRQQQELADDTFRELQEEFNRNRQQGQEQQGDNPNGRQLGENGQLNQQPGQQGEGERGQGQGNQLGDLADRQQALRDLLEQQRGEFPGDGIGGNDEFLQRLDEAERQMGQAQENLRNGDSSGALDDQADAMESLREGMRQLSEATRRAQAEQNGGQGQLGAQSGEQRDPLGRRRSQSGAVSGGEKILPTEDQYRRSREVMEEIRKRSGQRDRPTLELDYLKRLLDRF